MLKPGQHPLADIDFERVIDRRGGDSTKWNRYPPDILPMWVADMDFAAPAAVIEALHRRVAHGVFGYADPWPTLNEAVIGHLADQYAWDIEPEWLVWLPGLVSGLNIACRAVGREGEAVFSAVPVYPPFLSAPRHAGRRLITAPLVADHGRWQWDFAGVRRALGDDARLMLLCHPHNPVGRVWSIEELSQLADVAQEHGLFVCSDEIHCGLVLAEGRRHVPFALARPDMASRTITLMAPSKTFNIPGLGCAFAVISEPDLRAAFLAAMRGIVPHPNVLGLVATEAAFRHGAAWHQALLATLRRNRDRLAAAVASWPQLSMATVEGTYLAWMEMELPEHAACPPVKRFEAAGLGLSAGADFGGADYRNFVRLNFGCPPPTLDAALARMAAALAMPA